MQDKRAHDQIVRSFGIILGNWILLSVQCAKDHTITIVIENFLCFFEESTGYVGVSVGAECVPKIFDDGLRDAAGASSYTMLVRSLNGIHSHARLPISSMSMLQ